MSKAVKNNNILLNGIDVSRWQQKIDWKKVKKSGIDFAFIKASQGGSIAAKTVTPFTDSYFKNNIIKANKAGILCGVYHYLTGTTHDDVIAEAEYLINILEPYKDMITFPVALDFEDSRYTVFTKTYNAALICLFADIIKNAGYTPVLYANKSFLKNYIDMTPLADLDIWHARYYTPRSNSKIPSDINNMTVWQWSDRGRIEGIDGNVDLNMGFFDYSKKGIDTEPKENPTEKAPSFKVGDIVEIKKSAQNYFPGGPAIPDWVKNDYDHIITKDTYYKKKVFKGGSQCMLLGKKVSRKAGKTVAGINTWIAVENIKKCGK